MNHTQITQFFQVTTKYHNKSKQYFIYDPTNKIAIFDYKPEITDQFIIKKNGLHLYYRGTIQPNKSPNKKTCDISIPLLKSNLQKAIRRRHKDVAVTSALAILDHNPIELFRRLAIIFIEDVCLLDCYPIIIWWMIADKEYSFSYEDRIILIQIIESLCDIIEFLDTDSHIGLPVELTHKSLENNATVLALYYRSIYGGMKGDIEMLEKSIYYYANFPEKILKTLFHSNDIQISQEIEILEEAIDFHPYPVILTILEKKIGLSKEKIKETIWFTESGVNIRKKKTLEDSEKYKKTDEWKQIEPALSYTRLKMIN